MEPFELSQDPDGGGMTVRVSNGYVVLTRDEDERIAKRVTELEVENVKLRKLAETAWGCVNRHVSCCGCRIVCCGCTLQSAMRELGIEVDA